MISIHSVTKKFKGNVILENINLNLEKGIIYGFVGRNGSGKTVLFKMIAGFLLPNSGEIKINEKKIGKDIDFPANCGIIIESPGFINSLSGYKNLKLLSDIRGIISDNKIREYMEFFNLDPNDRKSVKNYSLGMKQKLGLIQALMEDPEILILDEPMNALDENTVLKVRELLIKIKKEKVILLASHNKEDIELLCDEIYSVKDRCITRMEI
ncbi:ABC transporter ATP-binding protein [Clostridium botulinum]|uniref:ABC transporter ATP-binding protein n=1 Tax=Clostridium botulinum TaxID=1491 RepID=UPI003DA483F5